MLTRFKSKLSKKTQLTEDVFLLKFDLVEPQEINFLAGQYLIILIPQTNQSDQFVKRLYSISSSPDIKNSFELLIKFLPGGVGSTYLTSLNEGSEMFFDGPAGVFTLKENNNNKIFLATGTGIAPIRSMLYRIQNSELKIQNLFLFWGLQYYKDVYLLDELKNFKFKISNFKFQLCLSRETSLDQIPEADRKYFLLGHINGGLKKIISNFKFQISNYDFYVCGNRQVVEDMKNYLLEKQIDKNKIYFEKF